MPHVRLILALHNHQPVGNFDGVFEDAYQKSYRPFLDVLEGYPEIALALHTSGPLLEWLVERRPEYVARLRALVEAGRVEVLGGGFFEPILTMLPPRDRVGQIRDYSRYLKDVLGARVRGIWIAERVWEQSLVGAIAEAGIEYTVLDDCHFLRAGQRADDVLGYYLTEDDGRLIKVFPGSERLRYIVPFDEPHASYEYLRRLAERRPGATVVFADDGEKFGAWPKTYDHVYRDGWLKRFCDMLLANREWLETTTFSRALDSTLPEGKIYLPDGSYREMTEWSLPAEARLAYQRAEHRLEQEAGVPGGGDVARFFRPGGDWRNFKVKYAECDEMYARMLMVSRRLAALEVAPGADPDYLEAARRELYRGQCNCPYWHGTFGGLYLPHLRNAIYQALINAENALNDAEGRSGPRVSVDIDDFNLDARQEVRLENDRLTALVRPARGGHLYELDLARIALNLLATLERRPEPYHDAIRAAAGSSDGQPANGEGSGDALKRRGLDRLLVYDRYPRKALVDHFYPSDVSLDDLVAGRDVERGDFVLGTYRASVRREAGRVALVMERPGRAGDANIRACKTVELRAGRAELVVTYVLEDVPRDEPTRLHFAVEINIAALAGHAPDRYYSGPDGARLGDLDARIDAPPGPGLCLTDEWRDLAVKLSWSRDAGVWCFPIETVSQREGGFEGVYQSSAVVPHWHVAPDDQGRWEVQIRCEFGPVRPSSGTEAEAEPVERARALANSVSR